MNKIITTTMFITMGFTGMVIGLLTQSPLDQPVDMVVSFSYGVQH